MQEFKGENKKNCGTELGTNITRVYSTRF